MSDLLQQRDWGVELLLLLSELTAHTEAPSILLGN
jgi:hypothetical protein